jgi:hypothetical protein
MYALLVRTRPMIPEACGHKSIVPYLPNAGADVENVPLLAQRVTKATEKAFALALE